MTREELIEAELRHGHAAIQAEAHKREKFAEAGAESDELFGE